MRLIDKDKLLAAIDKHNMDCESILIEPTACGIENLVKDAPTINQWHYPSKGEYPTETDDYLVYVNTKAVRGQKIMAIATYYVGAKEWTIDTDEYEFKYPPIAWISLPEPPKEEACTGQE